MLVQPLSGDFATGDCPPNPLEKAGYTLEFHDEFDGPLLDTNTLVMMVANVDEDVRNALESDVVKQWQHFEEDGSLIYQQRVVEASAPSTPLLLQF